jgi:hypothetical protein
MDIEVVDFTPGAVLRAVVPGWAHYHTGRRGEGVVYAASYAGCLLSGLILMGRVPGALLLGFAFALHLHAIVTALVRRFGELRARLLFTALCGLLLAVVLYIPAGRVLSRFATPLTFNLRTAPFQAGDVVWYRPASEASPGEYLLYNSAGTSATAVGGGYPAQVVIPAGLRVGRLVARAGQTISWRRGETLVDGRAAVEPLPVGLGSDSATFTVPPGHVAIHPVVNVGNYQVSPAAWRELILVPPSRRVGVIFFQTWPLTRAGFLP